MRRLALFSMVCFLVQSFVFAGEAPTRLEAGFHPIDMQSQKIERIATQVSMERMVKSGYPFRYTPLITLKADQSMVGQQPGWIKRHPVLFGTILGFGAGFAIGYASGDDGLFDDISAGGAGIFLGGIGAGVGALIGKAVSN